MGVQSEHPSILDIRTVSRSFGAVSAVTSVSLTIGSGEVYALVGKNGAGKTTLIKMIVGLLKPSSGDILLSAKDIRTHPVEAKSCFGYVPDDPAGYGYLTGREFLRYTGRLRGMDHDAIDRRISELLPVFLIKDVFDGPMEYYSRGNRQKVSILAAILTNPELLIIDEPIVGLDPESIRILGTLMQEYARSGRAVLFVTHILEFAARYASRIGLMEQGAIVADEPVTSGRLSSRICKKLEHAV